jgi:hypothetical protein
MARPSLGEPADARSLRRLKAYLERRRVVRGIAVETLRNILREKNVTFQRTGIGDGAQPIDQSL